ncbi:cytochrome c oxidase subunit NDUFA4-like isoform X1 [Branchiostoma floridae]|uniref:Cytochrome c oxidase subunit NDUFA4-like isoform X1 n=1 Tax=Branchiostoma floridae TaxID=7739 RepID=A0A9J7K688_BRAFL|nr:cytochrome c oxidase subunit NDUFA4-like isoform X1 [Branchiostoma floridae]
MAETDTKLPHTRGKGVWGIIRKLFVPHHEPSLWPLFLVVGLGGCVAGGYLLRLALRSPDVCWDKKNSPEPWNKVAATEQYKFYSPNIDYKKLEPPPKY